MLFRVPIRIRRGSVFAGEGKGETYDADAAEKQALPRFPLHHLMLYYSISCSFLPKSFASELPDIKLLPCMRLTLLRISTIAGIGRPKTLLNPKRLVYVTETQSRRMLENSRKLFKILEKSENRETAAYLTLFGPNQRLRINLHAGRKKRGRHEDPPNKELLPSSKEPLHTSR